MKRVFILAIAAVATTTMMISCGQGSAKLTTDADSLAYAIGVDMGANLFLFDSTLNPDVVAAGIKDAFAKKEGMSREEAGAFIQEYVTVRMPIKKAAEKAAEAKEFFEEAIKDGADTLASGLAYQITEAGNDVKPTPEDSVYANYILSLPNGKVLQESDEPYPHILKQNIQAWIEGVALVGEGGKITLYVPSKLGYGVRGGQPGSGIEPNQALKFEVEVVKVVKAEAPAAE